MLPLYDDNPTAKKPIVVYCLLGINLAIFLLEVFLSQSLEISGKVPIVRQFFQTWAVIPLELFRSPNAELATLVSYQFLHGSHTHLLGNMWYLWIFGNNIEDHLGKGKFLVFYIVCGVFAALVQAVFSWSSPVPLVGASGSVSGVMGAYIIQFPRTKILTFVPPLFVFWLPAVWLLGFWIFFQTFYALIESQSNVAFLAHVAGFAGGIVLFRLFNEEF